MWKATMAFFAMLAACVMLMPASASATKISNPSPPDFYGEVSGGFLQFVGNSGQVLQLSLDFESQGLSRPSFRGTINSAGTINVPQAQIVFPPLSLDLNGDTVYVNMQPTAPGTGNIDPLTGRVDFRVQLRIQLTGQAQGFDLGSGCYIGNSGNPIDINTSTHEGTFPSTSTLRVSSFRNDGAGFLGGDLPAEPYSDEAGVWPDGPQLTGVPYNYVPRVAGSWRGQNKTLRAIGASGCAAFSAADSIINDQLGLPSNSGDSTASLDFNFVAGGSRVGSNSMVRKGVKSDFIAPGISSSPWPSTQQPELPTTVPATIDASSSTFSGTPNAGGRYSFDLGTGTFGPYTDTAVQPISFATPGARTIRVRARDSDGDIDTKTRVINVVSSTDVGISTSAVGGSFRGGSPGSVRLAVTNNSSVRANTQPLTVQSTLPTGLSYSSINAPAGWNCSYSAPTVTCTLPTGQLAASATANIDVGVDVAAGVSNPVSVSSSVNQSGDPATGNNSSSTSVPVTKTDAKITMSHTGDVVANGTAKFDIDVSNVGDADTVGNTAVSLTLPSKLSYRVQGSGGSGWSCASAPTPQDVTCTRTASIAAGSSAPALAVAARVDRTGSGTVNANASVSTQGDSDAFGGSNTAVDPVEILVRPDVGLESSVSGSFTVGDPGQITFKATNESVVPVDGPTTVTSTLPEGLTIDTVSGTDWDCSASTTQDVTCSYAATLADGESAPNITANVTVGHDAYPGVTVDSAVENEDDAYAGNDEATTAITVKRIDVSLSKSAVRSFSVGIEGQYRLSVSNVGDAATVGQIKVVDDLPAELTLRGAAGGGWDCSASEVGAQHIECVINSSVAAGSGAPVINVRVDVLDAAAEAGEVTNTASVTTERDDPTVSADDPVSGNNSSTAITKAVSVDLAIESTHGTSFRTGTVETYSLKVRNVGAFATVAGMPVTVTDDLPAGMVPQTDDIWTDRTGWICGDEVVTSPVDHHRVTCVLAAPDELSPAIGQGGTATIEIPVAIGDSAVDPSVNVAEIATEKDASVERSPNNRSEDSTEVTRIDLAATASESIAPRAGGIGENTINIDNNGTSPTVNPIQVVMPLATGVSYRPTGSTIAGWQCASPGMGTQVTCVHQPAVPAGGSAPVLKLRTNVSSAAPDSWNTLVTVRTTGEVNERLGDNDPSVSQHLQKVDLTIEKSHVIGSVKSGLRGEYSVDVSNVGNDASSGTTTVSDTLAPAFENPQASGNGWSCHTSVQTVTCTRVAPIAAGASAPVIKVAFDVANDVAGTRDSTVTVSNPSDPYSANNSASDPITIVATSDLAVSVDQPAAMKVGEVSTVTYQVRNVGTDATSGDPSAHLKVQLPYNLEPVSSSSSDEWDCSQAPAGIGNAAFDCDLGEELAPGESTTVVARVRPLQSNETETATFASVQSSQDINRSNNFANATSSLSGLDLKLEVSPFASPADDDFVAGDIKKRSFKVSNVGTSSTTTTTRVKVPLPEGVIWVPSAPYNSWDCYQSVRTVVCEKVELIDGGASAPAFTLGFQASRQNADSVDMVYSVETQADGNPANDSVSTTETVLYRPETTITDSPDATTESKSASISFESDDPAATFECKLDGGAAEPCTSPLNLTGLATGGHSISVVAKNASDMVDPTPAEANWTITSTKPSGDPVSKVTATLKEGTLGLASLGEVPLPASQLVAKGDLYGNGSWVVPADGAVFKPIEQTLPVEGIGNVTVKIAITATGPASGKLTNGGGDASFNLPVQAKLEASLGSLVLVGPEADCYLRPIAFDLNGTYDEAGKVVTVGSTGVTFPQVSAGCGGVGGTVNTALGLPRSDIEVEFVFDLVKSAVEEPKCDVGFHGTPPNCIKDEPTVKIAKLTDPKITTSKSKVKSGKKVTIKYRVANTGDETATNVKVCLKLKKAKKLAKGKAKRCKTIKSIAPGKSGSVKFKVKTKKIKAKKKRLNFRVAAAYKVTDGTKTISKTGHVTLNR